MKGAACTAKNYVVTAEQCNFQTESGEWFPRLFSNQEEAQ
jgi:hypothetical protein